MPGPGSRASSRLLRALVPLLWCLMHTVWLAAWLPALFSHAYVYPAGVEYPLWLVPAILLSAAWLGRRMAHFKRGWLLAAFLGLALVVAVIWLLPVPVPELGAAERWRLVYSFVEGIPALFLAGVVTGGLWSAGLATDWSDQGALWRSFLVGVIALAILMLLPADTRGPDGASLGAYMALFVFCGLLLLALQSLGNVLTAQPREGAISLERYWLLSLGVVTIGILVVGSLLGLLFTPEVVARAAAVLWPAIRIILTPLVWIVQWLGYILMWLLAKMLSGLQLIGGEGQQVQEPQVPTDLVQQVYEIEQGASQEVGLPPNLGRIVLVALVIGALLLVAYVAWHRRGRRRRAVSTLEDRDSIMSRDVLLDQVREWLDGLRPRRPETPFDGELDASDPRHAIRLLYRRLLQAARRVGRPRAPVQTPSRFARVVSALIPAEQEDVEQLTRRYMDVRYGDRVPSPDQVAEAREAMDRVERALARRDGQA